MLSDKVNNLLFIASTIVSCILLIVVIVNAVIFAIIPGDKMVDGVLIKNSSEPIYIWSLNLAAGGFLVLTPFALASGYLYKKNRPYG